MELDSRKLLGTSGTQADNEAFTEFIQKNLKLYALNNDLTLSTHATANFMRNEVHFKLPHLFGVLLTVFWW